ncbi:MAG: bifunctional diaminohydroxyphosphoribosylaminopyrimidine deaminase/5-amino-6-(5-phosphoribosylamino)uracil reductase RibD [Nitrospirota bacterium]|nr:bifunctional diaminohydroxyphosphoribosylaminopyrimidine deaminase/5-amino-6-(5-phosphoribosylamino)uracil reductase RibD [Nitrospirota bacterium]
MDDERFIRRTIALAARAKSMTSPNPMVGALIVKKGRIISEAYHKKAGTPHAEVLAIDNAPDSVKGSCLYVSLEPCCHKDKRTPPCTQKIISSGIKKVVISMKDPNPKVSGKGIEELRKAGIEVISGVLDEESGRLNESYIKHITTGLPFVTLKVAMTLDGKIATPEGESKWITGEKARRMVHRLRGSVDAIMTAIGTVKADNPRLTCRTGNYKNPVRIIIDPDMEIPAGSNVLSTPPDTFIVTRKTATPDTGTTVSEKKKLLSEKNIRIIEYEGEKADLQWLMKKLGGTNIASVLIEGGSSLNSRCLEEEIVDKVMFFIAPKIIGGRESFPSVGGKTYRNLQDAHRLKDVKIKRIDEDILVEGYIRK